MLENPFMAGDCTSCNNYSPVAAMEPENEECEFFDDRCLIGMDTTFCTKDCAFATNSPCSTPPYGSRYMRGGRL